MGKRILEQAIKEVGYHDYLEIIYKSFELNSLEINDPEVSVNVKLAQKYGLSVLEAQRMTEKVANRAKQYGLNYHIDGMRQTNTFDAHRLMKYAETLGKEKVLTERLLQAHFCEGVFIGNRENLATLAQEIGLEELKVLDILNSDEFSDAVRFDEQEANNLGIRGVPFFLFNRQVAISGAQDVSVFIATLEKLFKEMKS